MFKYDKSLLLILAFLLIKIICLKISLTQYVKLNFDCSLEIILNFKKLKKERDVFW